MTAVGLCLIAPAIGLLRSPGRHHHLLLCAACIAMHWLPRRAGRQVDHVLGRYMLRPRVAAPGTISPESPCISLDLPRSHWDSSFDLLRSPWISLDYPGLPLSATTPRRCSSCNTVGSSPSSAASICSTRALCSPRTYCCTRPASLPSTHPSSRSALSPMSCGRT